LENYLSIMVYYLCFNECVKPIEINRIVIYNVTMKHLTQGDITMKFGRTLAGYLYAYLMGGLVTWICNFVFMRTLCCAIFGEEWGLFAADLIRYFCWPLVAFVFIYVTRRKDVTLKQEYLHRKEGRLYSFRTDVAEILRSSAFWKEFAIAVLLTLVYCLVNPFLLFINIPLFLAFNLGAYLHLHRTWLRDRLRVG